MGSRDRERDGGASGEQRSVASSHGTIEAIRNFIRSRYNNGFLNLENMGHDSTLRAAKIIPPGQTRGRSDVGTVMMKVAAELFPEVSSLPSRKVWSSTRCFPRMSQANSLFLLWTIDHNHLVCYEWSEVTPTHIVCCSVLPQPSEPVIEEQRHSGLQGLGISERGQKATQTSRTHLAGQPCSRSGR